MAWEWVAPVAAGAGASVGAVTTWLAARGGARTAERVAASAAESAERQARQERRDLHRAEAYVEVLALAEQMAAWGERVQPVASYDPPLEVPEPPDISAQTRVRALVGAHGSQAVRALVEQYIEAIKNIAFYAGVIETSKIEQQGRPREAGLSSSELWNTLENTLRPKMRSLLDTLTNTVNDELTGHGTESPGGS